MWYAIAIALVLIIAAFLLGLYLILRKIGNKVSDSVGEVPGQVVKETFSIIKDKIAKKNETRVSDSGQRDSKG